MSLPTLQNITVKIGEQKFRNSMLPYFYTFVSPLHALPIITEIIDARRTENNSFSRFLLTFDIRHYTQARDRLTDWPTAGLQ